MADVTITAGNVVSGAGATQLSGVAGEAITAGRAVYKDPTTKQYRLADSNSATMRARTADGIALNGASTGQPVDVHTAGELTLGATLVPGTAYYLSDTPGGIGPVADVAVGENVCLIGIAKTAAILTVDIVAPGVTL